MLRSHPRRRLRFAKREDTSLTPFVQNEGAKWQWSCFGEKLGQGSGISELMANLGAALADGDGVKMLGGGQPASIPELEAIWEERWQALLENDGGLGMRQALCLYDPPSGRLSFRKALARLLREQLGWEVSEENIAVTSGGQAAFFLLFNALAGEMPDGNRRKILLPLVPEYIGYADQGMKEELFQVQHPLIERTVSNRFKYGIDFENLEIGEDAAAICVSRPTNPSGNVLTDEEIARLRELARAKGIPLIIDNAYGAPFPQILFKEVEAVWDEDLIVTMSLSKLGLPATRTGIVVARPEVIRALESMTGVVSLANSNLGQLMVEPLVENGEILRLSKEVVQPFYLEKSRQALQWADEFFGSEVDYAIHESEGALFLWFWFPELPISSKELYERCKDRGVLVVPGEYFFFGEAENWSHARECVRVSFAMADEVVKEGMRLLAEEVKRAF